MARREPPDVAFVGERRRERRIAFHAFAVGLVVQVFPLRRRALGCGHLLQRIGLGAFLHEPHEGLVPMRGVQRDERVFQRNGVCLIFQIFTSSIHTVLGVRKLNHRFIGCAKPSAR